MVMEAQFDPLGGFAEIERLVGKVYFRFSHLFFHHPSLISFFFVFFGIMWR